MGITGSNQESLGVPGLLEKELIRDRVVAVIGPGHRWREKTSLSIRDLTNEPVILLPPITLSRRAIQKHFGQRNIPLRVEYEVSNIALIKRLVEKGLGVSFLCGSQIHAECSAGTLKALPFSDLEISRTINIVHHRDKNLSPALTRFIDYIEANRHYFQELLAGPLSTP